MPLPILTYLVNGKTFTASDLTQGLDSVSLKTAKEDSQVFYRTKWNGTISFVGADYDLFWELSRIACCQPVKVNLYRNGSSCSATDPYWKGVFNLSDLKFSVDTGVAELVAAPKPDDGYQTLLENWGKELNWLQIDTLKAIYSADRSVLYRRGRLLTVLLAGMVRLTLTGTAAASLIPVVSSNTISQFLEASLNPVTRRANPLKDAMIIQASDFAAPGPKTGVSPDSGFATNAILTLKDLVTELQELLCLYPYIDPATGKLRWEHESFFPGLTYGPVPAGFSLPDNSPVWKGQRVVSTALDALYGVYTLDVTTNATLSPQEAPTEEPYQFPVVLNDPYNLPNLPLGASIPGDPTVPVDFSKASILFDDACVSRLPGEQPISRVRSVSKLCTYTEAARSSPDNIDKANWLFLVQSGSSSDINNPVSQMVYGVTDTHGVNVENGNLSASSLLRDFHRHNQPFHEGYFNKSARYLPFGIRRGMLSIAPVRNLGSVSLSYCCDDTPVSLTGRIETWYAADGQLLDSSYALATEQLTLNLAHPGPCQAEAPTSFDPNGNPLACPPKGQFIRLEQSAAYPPGNTTIPCRVQVDMIYADGACGEYTITDITSNGTC